MLLNIALYWLLIFWTFWAWVLSLDELQNWPICPKLLGMPACYIILAAFITLFLLHLLKISKNYFYILISIPIGIALYGTTFQIFGWVECPKTNWGIPMCFISLWMFSSLLCFKYFLSKK